MNLGSRYSKIGVNTKRPKFTPDGVDRVRPDVQAQEELSQSEPLRSQSGVDEWETVTRSRQSGSRIGSMSQASQPFVPSVKNHGFPSGTVWGRRPSTFKIGEIVKVPHVVPNLKGGYSKEPEFDRINWPRCPLSAKFRPHIIVRISGDYMIGLPIFSHDGEGAINQSPFQAEEALYLKDAGLDPKSNLLLERVGHNRVLETNYNVKSGSVVYPGRTNTILYAWPISKDFCGALKRESKDRLLAELRFWQIRAEGNTQTHLQQLRELRDVHKPLVDDLLSNMSLRS